MKKKLVSVLLSAAMVSVLVAGCGGKKEESEGGAASGEKQTVTLRMWGAEEDQEFLKGMADSFAKEYADAADIIRLAEAEGLSAHANAVRLRAEEE